MHTLEAVARAVRGRLDGPADLVLDDLRPLEHAGPRHLTFVKDERHRARLEGSAAGAVLCREGDDVGGRPAVRVDNPRLAAARAAALFHPEVRPPPGIHPRAAVDPAARVPPSCHVGPCAVVEADAVLGEDVVVGPGAVVGRGARVGDGSVLDAGVVLYAGVTVGRRARLHAGVVVGSPGFGYEMGPEGPVAFPQLGTVVIGDDVRIGANTTIDRAALERTVVGDGTAIDNLVQVGHNVTIADGVLICALAGIGGGASFGRRAVLGPQGALAPDAHLGDGTILSARTALISHERLEDPGRVYMGVPAMPVEDWRRLLVLRRRAVRRARGGGGRDVSGRGGP